MSNYIPPKVWDYEAVKNKAGGAFGKTNRPIAGATHELTLPRGEFDYQLYSLNTPNGIKVNIILEELKALGKIKGYDAFLINIMTGDQFGTGFVDINPNSKIPALVDYSNDTPIRIFESGAILLYLANKHQVFLPTDPKNNVETLSWLMWQMGSAPFLGGGFGHFYAYAPEPIEYAINRYAMEAKRQLDVLDRQLADKKFVIGDAYTVADMAIFPWYGRLALGEIYKGENSAGAYNAGEFLQAHKYENVVRWANAIKGRAAVARAMDLELTALS